MKRLVKWLSVCICLLISFWGWLGWHQPALAGNLSIQPLSVLAATSSPMGDVRLCRDAEQKIDLNNANIVAFKDCPGFYPTLAQLIVVNSPYNQVQDVLDIPDLSDRQQELLQANLDNFTLNPPVVSLEQRMPPRPPMR